MADEVTGPDLENTIAIALTAVFILPALVSGEDDKVHVGWMSLLKTGPVYLLFLGLMLAAVCHNPESRIFLGWNMTAWNDAGIVADVEKDVDVQFGWQQNLNIVGVVLVWLSAVAVAANVRRYHKLVQKLKSESSAKDIRPGDEKVVTRTGVRKPVLFERSTSFKAWSVERVTGEKLEEQNGNLQEMVSVREYAEQRRASRQGMAHGKKSPWKCKEGCKMIKGSLESEKRTIAFYQGPLIQS